MIDSSITGDYELSLYDCLSQLLSNKSILSEINSCCKNIIWDINSCCKNIIWDTPSGHRAFILNGLDFHRWPPQGISNPSRIFLTHSHMEWVLLARWRFLLAESNSGLVNVLWGESRMSEICFSY